MLHLFTLLLFLPSIFASLNLDNDCWSYGACLQSVMIDQMASKDPLTCETFCQSKPDCSWFTYYEDYGVCVALTECVKVDQIRNTISGNSKCTSNLECNLTGRCTGVLESVSQAESVESCHQICLGQDSRCQWFTYDSDSKSCFSLQDCVALDENCLTCTSGQANCPLSTSMLTFTFEGKLFTIAGKLFTIAEKLFTIAGKLFTIAGKLFTI